jgi:hypothetical protein
LSQQNFKATPMGSENIWITITTIMLMLSLISERVSNLVKLNWPVLRDKGKTENEEKIRERNVLVLAVVSGCLVAIVAGADLFTLVNKGKLLNANSLNRTNVLGMLLSGLFISLGSKFWHDVLDIVLQFSKLKKFKALNEKVSISENPNTYNLLKEKEQNLEHVIRGNLDKLRALSNYRGYNIEQEGNSFVAILKFVDQVPLKGEISWIENYLKPEEYKTQLTSKTVLSGN